MNEAKMAKARCLDCYETNLLNGCGGRCQTCYARWLRLKHRHKKRTCTVCKTAFTTTRIDASFCSSACRQWAYRRRKGPGVTEKRGAIIGQRFSVTK